MNAQWRPTMLIAIDFGMTCTGVAYSSAPEWPPPKALQRWPGKRGGELSSKVKTAVSYHHGTPQVSKWGFEVDLDDPTSEDLFKLYLDPMFDDGSGHNRLTVHQARDHFRAYLSCLYLYITNHFYRTMPDWSQRQVEFIFSVPTTWKAPAIIHEIDKNIRMAGFGTNPNHRVSVGLTEAEAAAVYALQRNFRQNDVILIMDAGGGTSDVNVLKVVSSIGRRELKPLAEVSGKAIGSTLIDFRVQHILVEQLARLPECGYQLDGDLHQIAQRIMREGGFENFKHSFGDEATDNPFLFLNIPGLPPGVDLPQLGIRSSKIILTRETLQWVFDEQIDKLIALVDEQLTKIAAKSPFEQVSWLILSGGLGSSPYLQKRLRARYEQLGGARMPNAQNMRILEAGDNPQLAVCHGMVMDRSQEIASGASIYTERCARLSYGVVARFKYDPQRHVGERVETDRRDNQQYAEDMIDWFVVQGQPVSVDRGIEKPYRIKFDIGQPRYTWNTRIVASDMPAASLPRSLRYNGANQICVVQSEIDQNTMMKHKNRKWWQFGPQYMRAQFTIRVLIGPADLKFEMLTPAGVCSKNSDAIGVDWYPTATNGNMNGSIQNGSFGMERM